MWRRLDCGKECKSPTAMLLLPAPSTSSWNPQTRLLNPYTFQPVGLILNPLIPDCLGLSFKGKNEFEEKEKRGNALGTRSSCLTGTSAISMLERRPVCIRPVLCKPRTPTARRSQTQTLQNLKVTFPNRSESYKLSNHWHTSSLPCRSLKSFLITGIHLFSSRPSGRVPPFRRRLRVQLGLGHGNQVSDRC